MQREPSSLEFVRCSQIYEVVHAPHRHTTQYAVAFKGKKIRIKAPILREQENIITNMKPNVRTKNAESPEASGKPTITCHKDVRHRIETSSPRCVGSRNIGEANTALPPAHSASASLNSRRYTRHSSRSSGSPWTWRSPRRPGKARGRERGEDDVELTYLDSRTVHAAASFFLCSG